MTITPEPRLLDCMAMTDTDHKSKRVRIYCFKHGTVVFDATMAEADQTSKENLLPLWRTRSCREQD